MKQIIFVLVFFISTVSFSQQILSEREQAEVIDEILGDRLNNLLPTLMDDNNIDMWILISREYNEDPVLKTMLPATWLNARRRTIILFYRDKEKNTIDKLAVARYNFGDNIFSAWDKEKQPNQWMRLVELIEERNPKTIGLNFSKHFNIADGLDKTDHEEFMEVLPKRLQNRVISAQPLATAWIETRTPREMIIYNQLVDVTHDIIAEAFSEKVITPGITTTTDVQWWFRQKVIELGLKTWFHPSVSVQRKRDAKLDDDLSSFFDRPDDLVILPGDLLHCDFGITYLRLNTDCQEHAYVLKPKETSPPKYLTEAFTKGNRLQDIFTSNFKTGRSGNDILAKSLSDAKTEGLKPTIYTHPLGSYGHSSGTTLGMWDAQGGVPGNGDYPLHKNTVYAIELNTAVDIPEWNRDIRIMLEEAGFWGENGFRYVNGRQTEILTVPRVKEHQGN